MARNPIPDLERDAALKDVVRWTEDVGKRCWAYVHRSTMKREHFDDHNPLTDTIAHYIERWRIELGVTIPGWLELQLAERCTAPLLVRYVERSGFKPRTLARVQRAGTATICGISQVVPLPVQQEPHRIFKSIRRYLVKHVLGNRVALMVWVGRNLSAPEFRRRVAAEPYVRIAWTVLYWLQSTHWADRGVREWFRRLLGITAIPRGDNDPTYHWCDSIQDHVVIHLGNAYERWIVNWINAAALLDVWPTQEDLDRYSTDEAFMWPKSPPRRQPIRWWAWIDDDEQLALGVYRRKAAWLAAAPRRSKQERRDADALVKAERQRAVLDGMSAPVIRLRDTLINRPVERSATGQRTVRGEAI